jgi:hypothetical protein
MKANWVGHILRMNYLLKHVEVNKGSNDKEEEVNN